MIFLKSIMIFLEIAKRKLQQLQWLYNIFLLQLRQQIITNVTKLLYRFPKLHRSVSLIPSIQICCIPTPQSPYTCQIKAAFITLQDVTLPTLRQKSCKSIRRAIWQNLHKIVTKIEYSLNALRLCSGLSQRYANQLWQPE